MPDFYHFFFSYAHDNHTNAKWEHLGNTGNHLDEFFDALCREVSDRTGLSASEVAYRDKSRLKVGDFWDPGLVDGLQKSRVLVCVVSPHYVKSSPCKRELAFFHRRFEEYVRLTGNATQTHRILPLFWLNTEECYEYATPGIKKFLRRYNYTQEGMPAEYPVLGLLQMCRMQRERDSYVQVCQTLAKRIVDLSLRHQPLPQLRDAESFGSQEGIEELLSKEERAEVVFSGPAGANVIYFVGTRAQMEAAGITPADSYADARERWHPFPDSPGATVEWLTREGARQIGLSDLRNLGLPDRLELVIKAAKQKNSPLLFVLDRDSLSVREISERMLEYDQGNHDNCGLVTAGGAASDDQLRQVFKYKFTPNYLHHAWKVPAQEQEYVDTVASVLGGIKRQLMSQGRPDAPYARMDVPGLLVPFGG